MSDKRTGTSSRGSRPYVLAAVMALGLVLGTLGMPASQAEAACSNPADCAAQEAAKSAVKDAAVEAAKAAAQNAAKDASRESVVEAAKSAAKDAAQAAIKDAAKDAAKSQAEQQAQAGPAGQDSSSPSDSNAAAFIPCDGEDCPLSVYGLIARMATIIPCDQDCENRVTVMAADLALAQKCSADPAGCRQQIAAFVTGLARNVDCDDCRKKIDALFLAYVLRSSCAGNPDACRRNPSVPAAGNPSASAVASTGAVVPAACPVVVATSTGGTWQVALLGDPSRPLVPLTDLSSNNLQPTLSPDCARIAFVSDRNTGWAVFVMNADGTGQTPVTAVTAAAESPLLQAAPPVAPSGAPVTAILQPDLLNLRWTPDGQGLVFQSYPDGQTHQIAVNPGTTRLP